MGIYNDASLIMYPSGVKASKIYCQKPTDGSGDLTFTRASTATRVNSSGLIESVAANVARIDYTGGGCGKLLLEPQRTNLMVRSSELDDAIWFKSSATITANATTSPDGTTNADLVSGSIGKSLYQGSRVVTASTVYTFSFYVKNVDLTYAKFAIYDETNAAFIAVDIPFTPTAEWTRVSYTFTTPSGCVSARPYLLRGGINTGTAYFWGTQLESGSYPTSYIPTAGSAVTRLADLTTFSTIKTSGFIGASAGSFYIHLLDNIARTRITGDVSLFLGTTAAGATDSLVITQPSGSSRLVIGKYVGGVYTLLYTTTTDVVKIAFKWNGTTADVYVNGTKQVSATSFTATSLEYLEMGAVDVVKKVQTAYFATTALADATLATLTTI